MYICMRRTAVAAAAAACFLCGRRRMTTAAGSRTPAPGHDAHVLSCGRHAVDVLVSLPPDYTEKVTVGREKYNVLYVLDASFEPGFHEAVGAARSGYAAMQKQEGRGWFPDLIVVGLTYPKECSARALVRFLGSDLIPFVDATYSTKPYAAARAAWASDEAGSSALGLALTVNETTKLIRYFAIGVPQSASVAASAGPSLPEKAAVFLGTSDGDGDAMAAARRLETALTARVPGSGVTRSTTMFVDRHGEQHYTQHEQRGAPPITLDRAPTEPSETTSSSATTARSFADRGVRWVCERLEWQKLESLGQLFPWHEFK